MSYDLGAAIIEKLAFNRGRLDYKVEHRQAPARIPRPVRPGQRRAGRRGVAGRAD